LFDVSIQLAFLYIPAGMDGILLGIEIEGGELKGATGSTANIIPIDWSMVG